MLTGLLTLACVGPAASTNRPSASEPANATDAQIVSQQAILRLHPHDRQALVSLSGAYLQKVREVGDPGYYPKIQSLLETALAQQPNDPRVLTQMGVLSLSKHQFAEALTWGQRAAAAQPNSAGPLGVVVDAQVELGRYEEAVNTAQTMVDRRPDLSSYARISYLRELHGDVPGAIRAMKQALKAGGETGENVSYIGVQLGHLYFSSGDMTQAAAAYDQADRSFPGYIHASAGRAKVAAARGRLQFAVDTYRRVVAIFPTPEYVIALGDAYASLGDAGAATASYQLAEAEQKLYQSSGVNIDAELALYAADHHRNVDEGVAAARRAIVDRPTIGSADVLAWTLYQTGDFSGALVASQQSHRLGTQEPLLFFHRGMIESKLGMNTEARRDLARALSLNPNFSLLWAKPARDELAQLGGRP